MKKLSVIVPVYNVSPYIEKCMDSLLGQSYQEMELILVDDGSTDDSGFILDSYAQRNKKVRVFHQKNSGAAKARKKGIEAAQGEYLTFVDADDHVESTYFELMMEEVEDFDLLTAGYYEEQGGADGEGKKRIVYGALPEGAYITSEDRNYLLCNMIYFHYTVHRGLTPFIWDKVYRTSLVKDVMKKGDDTIRFAEDSEFLYRYVLMCGKVKVSSICGYHYVWRADSAVRNLKPDFIDNIPKIYCSLRRDFERHDLKNELMWQLEAWMCDLLQSVPKSLGFYYPFQQFRYIFPFFNRIENVKVVLYGAGAVGRDYYRQLKQYPGIEVCCWADKNKTDNPGIRKLVQRPSDIQGVSYDYIIVAIKRQAVYLQIKAELNDIGVSSEKILWEMPIEVV